ncbi:MAG: trehalose utilization protein ThuA [Planctomycetota bacterium]|nr:MAG: trehalose utilization protein ThuA [Planctomycetota bacterium]
MSTPLRVTIWNEFRHETKNPAVQAIYPDGIHHTISQALQTQAAAAGSAIALRTATLDEPNHGLSEEILADTDVLFWWGHCAHGAVADSTVDLVQRHVLEGMGLVVLHSGHFSKIFRRLLGTNCSLKWREKAEKERLWVIEPSHPICQGLGEYIELPHTEMYGERFDIPTPDELLFISWFAGGEVFRSGCTWRRGHGKIFYFRPGHETYPIYHNGEIQRVLYNAAHWARPSMRKKDVCPNSPELEPLPKPPASFGSAGIVQSAKDIQ